MFRIHVVTCLVTINLYWKPIPNKLPACQKLTRYLHPYNLLTHYTFGLRKIDFELLHKWPSVNNYNFRLKSLSSPYQLKIFSDYFVKYLYKNKLITKKYLKYSEEWRENIFKSWSKDRHKSYELLYNKTY